MVFPNAIVIVFYFVIVLLLFRFCLLITLTRCLIGHNLESLFEGATVTGAGEAFCSGWGSRWESVKVVLQQHRAGLLKQVQAR